MRLTLLALAAAFALAGCKSPCVQLAEKMCECEKTTTARDDCNRRASDENSRITVSTEQENRCDALIDKCDCNAISTPEGKLACGLARDPSGQ